MISAAEFQKKVKENTPPSGGLRRSISRPVIREEGGQRCLSAYMIIYTKEDLEKKEFTRPMWYCTASLDDGSGLIWHECRPGADFSETPANARYPISGTAKTKADKNSPLAILDEARTAFLAGDDDTGEQLYRSYMTAVLDSVPEAIGRFYRELGMPASEAGHREEAPPAGRTEDSPSMNVVRSVLMTGIKEENGAAEETKQKEAEPEESKPDRLPDAAAALLLGICRAIPPCGTETVSWNPEAGLSVLTNDRLAILLRIADRIRFLETDKKGRIKIAFPAVCREGDLDGRFDTWQEMQYRVLAGDPPYGHLLITPRRNLFTRCAAAEKCAFAFCPYIAAAYVRFLAGGDENRFQKEVVDTLTKRRLPSWPKEAGLPVINDRLLDKAEEMVRSGLAGTSEKTGLIRITYVSSRRRHADMTQFDGDTVLIGEQVSVKDFLAGTDDEGRYIGADGRRISQMASAVLAASAGAGCGNTSRHGGPLIMENAGGNQFRIHT